MSSTADFAGEKISAVFCSGFIVLLPWLNMLLATPFFNPFFEGIFKFSRTFRIGFKGDYTCSNGNALYYRRLGSFSFCIGCHTSFNWRIWAEFDLSLDSDLLFRVIFRAFFKGPQVIENATRMEIVHRADFSRLVWRFVLVFPRVLYSCVDRFSKSLCREEFKIVGDQAFFPRFICVGYDSWCQAVDQETMYNNIAFYSSQNPQTI